MSLQRRNEGAGHSIKHDRGWGRRGMRYPASEKLEIIRLVEQSHLPVRRTLDKLGIQRARFYRWYDRLQTGGPEALEDKAPRPKHVWNRIPDAIRAMGARTCNIADADDAEFEQYSR